MAEQKLDVTIKWENDNYFEVKAKKNGGENFTIIRNDENSHLLDMWPGVRKAVIRYFESVLSDIRSDMAEEV